MKLRNYLNETNLEVLPKNKIKIDNEIIDIPREPQVIVMGDVPKPKNTVMVYIDKNTEMITSMDNKNNLYAWPNHQKFEKYLKDKGFVYFEGYNKF